jgi:hypothetical protein
VGDAISTVTSSGTLKVRTSLDNVRLSGSGNGFHAKSGSLVSARNCVFANNTSNGIFVDAAGAQFAFVSVWASQISGNGTNGLQAGNAGNVGGSGAEIAQNQISRNGAFGVTLSTGGAVNTFSNNGIFGNVSGDTCTGCTPVGPGQ